MTLVTIKTVELGDAGFAGLTAIVDKLNKRADRHGMNKLVVTVKRTFTVRNEETGVDENRRYVEIDGRAPCIDGWHLAAVVSRNDCIGTLVKTLPGKFADCDYSEYRTHDFSCDHCGFNRRRNDVFVIADDNGKFQVVGRNCLADFLRCKDAASFAEYAEWFDKLDGMGESDFADVAYGDGFGGRACRPVLELRTYLAVVRVCETKLGWTSRKDCYNNPGRSATADDAYFVILGGGKGHSDFVKGNDLHVRDSDYDYADKVIAWVTSLTIDTTGKSEYLDTIARIGHAGILNSELAGYAASIGRAYENDCKWSEERAEKAAGHKEKDFIGDADKKGQQDLGVVRIVRIRYIEGEYGVRTIVAMEADLPNGKVAPITWFASGEKEYEEGDEYTLRAGIKGHEDNAKWGKQTTVTRAKLTACATVTA